MERSGDGRRAFIVTTYAAFWARYEGMLPQHRHYYEIIRQEAPCHLYFGAPPLHSALYNILISGRLHTQCAVWPCDRSANARQERALLCLIADATT